MQPYPQFTNRFQAALHLWSTYDGVVPPEAMKAFLEGLVHSDQLLSAPTEPGSPWQILNRVFITGSDPFDDDNVVFLDFGYIINSARLETVLAQAKTWGELLAIDTTGQAESYFWSVSEAAEYQNVKNFLDNLDEHPDTESYALFRSSCEALDLSEKTEDTEESDRLFNESERLYELYEKTARKEFDDLDPGRERPLRKDDPFDLADFQSFCFNHGIDLNNPATDMYGMVPSSIIKKFAELGDSMWSLSPFVSFRAADRKVIIRAFEDLDYIVIEDEHLIATAYGGALDLEWIDKKVASYVNLAEIMMGLQAAFEESEGGEAS